MKADDFAARQLPKKRTGARVRWLANASATKVGITGVACYVTVVFCFWIVESIYLYRGAPLVVHQENNAAVPADACQILYFNFVTILTIGYGDFIPVGLGRLFVVLEGIIGAAVFGLTIAALAAKFLSPPRNAIVFSRYGYYCTNEERFLLIFVNTTKNFVINAEMSSYFKLGGDWGVRPSIKSPFITQAVQTFFMDHVCLDSLVNKLRTGDAFRFGISGTIGHTAFSTAIEYSPVEIIVLPNRDELISFKGFKDPNFSSEEFVRMFYYRPANAPTLLEFVDDRSRTKQA